MKISGVDAIPVSVPFIEPFEIAGGRATHGNHVIVRVTTRDGHVGHGESAPMSSYSPQTQTTVISEIARLESAMLGRDPFSLEAIHQELRNQNADCFAAAGVDIALHDLVGRVLGVPIHQLLGGSISDQVDLSWAMGYKSCQALATEAKRYAHMGFRTMKVKVGASLALDVKRVRAVREALGSETQVKVDANQGYDLKTAIRAAAEFQKLGVSVIEQPLPREDLVGLRRLRERTTIPVMVDESLYSAEDALRILEMRAADVFNIKIMKPGGIRPSAKLAAVAEAAHMPCMLGSMPELGIGTLGGLQLAVTQATFTYGSELIGPWMFEDDLLKRRPLLRDGRLVLPRGPGLGIEVDEAKIQDLARQ